MAFGWVHNRLGGAELHHGLGAMRTSEDAGEQSGCGSKVIESAWASTDTRLQRILRYVVEVASGEKKRRSAPSKLKVLLK
jgi:hypothetical protein